jgi:hypothetical protein
MSAPLDTKGLDSGLLLNRHFTRAGRDPLALAPFEERIIKGRVLRVPSSWGPGGLAKLSQSVTDQPTKDFLISRAKGLAEDAHKAGLVDEGELVILIDELAWVIGRGMGWVGEESGMWVGVINLHHFCEPVTQRFDLAGLKQAARCLLIAAAGQAVGAGVPGAFSLGWTNGAGFLLVAGIAYDSSRGVGILGNIAAMVLGQSCQTSAQLAGKRPDLAKEEDKSVVLTGLQNAKGRITELPPTSPVSSAAEGDRWLAQTQELLDDATLAVQEWGVLGAYPTAPQPCAECEVWLDPLSTLAEAIPSLQRTDLASHPEIRSSLKAMGLAESQRGAVLTALSSGESILSAGVPEAKAPSLKTALGAWSFHPNAQLMMGSAVSPYVAGVLKHRVHLPAGIPDEFAASVMGAAARFGLTGAEPCIQTTKVEDEPDETALDITATAPEAEAPPVITFEAAPSGEADPQPAIDPDPVSDIEPTDLVETEVAPEAPVAVEPESEVTSLVDTEAETEPETAHDLVQSEPEPLIEEISSPGPSDESPVPTLDLTPPPLPDPILADAAGALGAAGASQAVNHESSEPEPGPKLDLEVEAEVDSETLAVSEEMPSEGDITQLPGEEPTADRPTTFSDEETRAQSPDAPEVSSETPSLDETSTVPCQDGPVAAASCSQDDEMAQSEESFGQPLVTELAWSKSVMIRSHGANVVLHAVRRTPGAPIEASVTAPNLTPFNRSLLDALLGSVNLGLSQGVSLDEYRRSLSQPGLVRDILQTLSELSDR